MQDAASINSKPQEKGIQYIFANAGVWYTSFSSSSSIYVKHRTPCFLLCVYVCVMNRFKIMFTCMISGTSGCGKRLFTSVFSDHLRRHKILLLLDITVEDLLK